MNKKQMILGFTKEDNIEVISKDYVWKGKSFIPTREAEEQLERFAEWKNLSIALEYNPSLRETLEDMLPNEEGGEEYV
jgi:hypothetical protein